MFVFFKTRNLQSSSHSLSSALTSSTPRPSYFILTTMLPATFFIMLALAVKITDTCGPSLPDKAKQVVHVHQHSTEGNSQEGGFHIMEIHVGTVSWTVGSIVGVVILIALAIYLYLRWRRRAVRQDENRRLRSWAFGNINPWRSAPAASIPMQQMQHFSPPTSPTPMAIEQATPFPQMPQPPLNVYMPRRTMEVETPPDYKPSIPPGI